MYLRALENMNFEGLNEEEIKELVKRKEIIEWSKDEPDFKVAI